MLPGRKLLKTHFCLTGLTSYSIVSIQFSTISEVEQFVVTEMEVSSLIVSVNPFIEAPLLGASVIDPW